LRAVYNISTITGRPSGRPNKGAFMNWAKEAAKRASIEDSILDAHLKTLEDDFEDETKKEENQDYEN